MKRRLTGWQRAWQASKLCSVSLLLSAAGYIILTGLVSLTVAWGSRRPGILGPMTWLLVAGWAAHATVIAALMYFGAWDVGALDSEPKPWATFWNSVAMFTALLLGGHYVLWRRPRYTLSG